MRKILALVACCTVVTVPFALADEGNNTQQPKSTTTCPSQPLAEARAIIKEAWDREGWRQRNPVKKQQTRELAELRGCLDANGRKKLSAYAQKTKADFKFHRAYRSVAPYAGFSGEGYMLRWLAIPRYIVACETNGYHGEGRWHATNGSTNGPYQFIGWPVPWPANTDAEKLAHHRMASQLALSNWACL